MAPYIGAEDEDEPARLEAQAAGAREELRAALALHPVPAGARVLELGCGGGVLTRALAAALPDATILATDRDARLLAHAHRALADEVAAGRVRFERADAASLPYPARSFDLAACRCLLMHQPDPLVVVAEMFRALEVGGVALALEPDWGARARYPDGEALAALLDLARRARPYGFPDLLLGRTLYALFRAAGFAEVRVAVTSFVETAGDRTAEAEAKGEGTGPARLLAQGRALLRSAGLANDAMLDALIARLEAAPRHPEYFSAGLDFAAAGRKPAPSLDPAAW
jgi:SAM-dependent methyltransferase